jgi:invasion protein IalB
MTDIDDLSPMSMSASHSTTSIIYFVHVSVTAAAVASCPAQYPRNSSSREVSSMATAWLVSCLSPNTHPSSSASICFIEKVKKKKRSHKEIDGDDIEASLQAGDPTGTSLPDLF